MTRQYWTDERTIDHLEVTELFPGTHSCYNTVWPDCVDFYKVPDGRIVPLCPYSNKEFLKTHPDWEKLDD